MLRRSFLKRAALAAIASGWLGKLPFPSDEDPEPIPPGVYQAKIVSVDTEAHPRYIAVTYALGFKVTQEMIEDDVYGSEDQLMQLITRFHLTPARVV
jgi:hypothetical protein